MASSFDALPPEIVQKCVEFLDFDLVSGDLKAVSKATLVVARRALTRGRWRPFRYVAEQGLAAVSDIDHRAFFLEPPAAVCVPCREAWALDPALVIRLICDWDTAHFFLPGGSHLDRERADQGVYHTPLRRKCIFTAREPGPTIGWIARKRARSWWKWREFSTPRRTTTTSERNSI